MITIAFVAAGAVLAANVLTLLHLHVARDMDRELPIDSASVSAYDRVSRSALFYGIRWLFMRRLRRLKPAGTLVDAGCGPGHLAIYLARHFPRTRIIGIDISSESVALAKNNRDRYGFKEQVRFEVAAVEQLPLPDSSVDFVVSTLSLHHWSVPQVALEEVYRVLKPGGQMLIFDLRRDMPSLLYWIFRFGQRYLIPADLKRTNGAVGSVWASFDLREMEMLLAKSPFPQKQVMRGWGWAWLYAKK